MSQDNLLEWKKPDEVMRLHRFKVKQKALQARINRSNKIVPNAVLSNECTISREKRKNPFARENNQVEKKAKIDPAAIADSNSDSALFNLISNELVEKPTVRVQETDSKIDPEVVDDYVQPLVKQEINEIKPVGKPKPPIDWSLKLKIRVLSRASLPGHPKTSQEASGLTSFVRCLHTSEDLPPHQGGGLDTSLGARLQQSSLYWIHPSIPGEKLFPRKLRNSATVAGLPQQAMLLEWSDSFRSLFQLLRAKQCPYFYLCANAFTALFRAGGVGGQTEPHVIITPTTQGLRQTLKQEEIEFKMPLRKSENNLNDSGEAELSNPSQLKENISDINPENCDDDDADDEISHEQWLESLGVDDVEIKKINYSQARKDHATECKTDFSDISLILIQGPDLQALYNFLLNSKSTVGGVGVIPPTLLAPTAFVGATLKLLPARFSRIKQDGLDYHSLELRGPILPNVIRSICDDLSTTRDNFSITMNTLTDTRAFSKASKIMATDVSKGNVFSKENLSSCGLSGNMLNDICLAQSDYIANTEQISYQENVGYLWS